MRIEEEITEKEKEEEEKKAMDLREFYVEARNMLNDEQREVLERVRKLMDKKEEKRTLFLQGEAGTGKTFLYKVITAMVKAEFNEDVIQTATTGIAATLLYDGTTMHRRFKIPLQCNEDSQLTLLEYKREAEAVKKAQIIIID